MLELTQQQEQLIADIQAKAEELKTLYAQVESDIMTLATTELDNSVARVIREITLQ